MLSNDQPLWMPAGSVRSVLALGTVGAYVAGLIEADIAFVVLGFYFGVRSEDG